MASQVFLMPSPPSVVSSCLRMSEGSRVAKSKVNESNIMRDVLALMRNYGKRGDLSTMLSFRENMLPKHMFRIPQDDDTSLPIKQKVRFEPKAHGISPKNGAPNVSISAKDGPNIVHTSSKEQPAKVDDIPSSGGDSDVLDDMESEEEVEFVFDETVNLLKTTKIRVSTYKAHDVSKN
ncbi:hypothetical protein Tco_0759132 [Tanacetum coccineum]